MTGYPSFRIKQWGYGAGVEPSYIFVTSMPLKSLWKADIDRWSNLNREGYQRITGESRFGPGQGSITRYLMNELGAFPTSVLINIRGKVDFSSIKQIAENIDYGTMTIPDDSKLIIIDGQHRLEALKRIRAKKPELENYPVPVSLMNLDDKFDEMVHFFIVNSRQKSIPTDLVYRQLQNFMEKAIIERRQWIKDTILGPKQERQALSATIVDFLDTESTNSPFRGRIQYVGQQREERHLVKDYYLARFLTKILSEKALRGLAPPKLANLYADYWSALQDLYPNCFKKPEEYSLLKTTGIATYTYLFPTVFAYCAADGKINKNEFSKYLEMLFEEIDSEELEPDFQKPLDEKWWSAAHGPAIARGTNEGAFEEIVKNMTKKIELAMKNKK